VLALPNNESLHHRGLLVLQCIIYPILPCIDQLMNNQPLHPTPVFFAPLPVRYLNHTGLMWENAPRFGALMVFAEHRCGRLGGSSSHSDVTQFLMLPNSSWRTVELLAAHPCAITGALMRISLRTRPARVLCCAMLCRVMSCYAVLMQVLRRV
jgi:hypothetical protein